MKSVLAFYYPWYWTKDYSGYWSMWDYGGKHNPDVFSNGNRRDISCPHYPETGPYDSNDSLVIKRHFEMAAQAGIDAFIVSWWGQANILNRPFGLPETGGLLDYAKQTGIKVTVYYETVPSVPFKYKNTAIDIVEFTKKYGTHPGFFKVDHRPAIFFYRRIIKQHSPAQWSEIIKFVKSECDAILIADTLDPEIIRLFDGAHTYSPYEAHLWRVDAGTNMRRLAAAGRANNKYVGLSVMPGFDDRPAGNRISLKRRLWQAGVHLKKDVVVARKDGLTYSRYWEQAIKSSPDWILICSFNEWIEGSEIEPSLEYGSQYLELTGKYSQLFKAGVRPFLP